MGGLQLSITNQYMFNRVMTNEDICKQFLERVIGKEIDSLEYKNAEQAYEPRVGAKGVRLDLFAKGVGEVYDIELQVRPKKSLMQRFRYYQAAIDTAVLEKGANYRDLPESYIIFVCDHDPFAGGLPIYTIGLECKEAASVDLDDGAHWIALNCPAYRELKDQQLKGFMEYISTGRIDDEDKLVVLMAEAVNAANEDRKWVDDVFSVSTIEGDIKRDIEMAREDGFAEAEARDKALVEKLFADGREQDVLRAFQDAAFKQSLIVELSIQ